MDKAKPDPGGSLHAVILGHPSQESFNAAIANHYSMSVEAAGQRSIVRDLYREGFDPRLSEAERTAAPDFVLPDEIDGHLKLIRKAKAVVLICPLWFGTPPAIIKGYVDRVFGALMRDTQSHPQTALSGTGKTLAVVTTSASTLPWLEQRRVWSSLRQSLDEYLKLVLGFDRALHHHIEQVTDDLSDEQGAELLEGVERFATDLCKAMG